MIVDCRILPVTVCPLSITLSGRRAFQRTSVTLAWF